MTVDTTGYRHIGPWHEPGDYRGALVLPYSADGRVLLQLRDDRPDILAPGKWSCWGGGIEPGESPPVGAARELEEETGIALPVSAFVPAYTVVTTPPRYGLFFIHAAKIATPVDQIRVHEGSGFGLVTRAQASRLDIIDYIRPVIDAFWDDFLQKE